MVTSEQIRAARMLIRWEQKHLAQNSGVSLPTVKRLETKPGVINAHASTIAALCAALEAAGVHFVSSDELGPGVRLKLPLAKTDPPHSSHETLGTRKMTLLGPTTAAQRAARTLRKIL